TESGRTVHWATGLQHQKQKNHGLRASLRFALRPWFQDSHRKWYNYWGQVSNIDGFVRAVLALANLEAERFDESDKGGPAGVRL
ncbi:MAG: hypothetical protein QF451_06950, partial [Nitrospinota bacterium]|nr:hypothetical protein [Nitrospinota bacterium]